MMEFSQVWMEANTTTVKEIQIFCKIKLQKNVSLVIACESGDEYYLDIISRVIVGLTVLLAHLANSVTSNVKVLTSVGVGMLYLTEICKKINKSLRFI